MRVGLLSLEPWDSVWRRNQHLASRLVERGTIGSLLFVNPPHGGVALRARRGSPLAGIEVITPPLIVPRRYGGHRLLARWLRRALADVDLLWINDPVAGVGALRDNVPAVYDVTDDWRSASQPPADRLRVIAAEDLLSRRARTIVCSDELAERWRSRYDVDPVVVRNGVDVGAIRTAEPIELPGSRPHAVYVGTIHPNRVDLDLVAVLAAEWPGTIHLVGPNDGLDAQARCRLVQRGVQLHGPVPSEQVPSWLVAADVLICPHLVDDFTLSLDAIKSHEYLATDRPIVATASSGFQSLVAAGLNVVTRAEFVDVAVAAGRTGPLIRTVAVDWDKRALQFGFELETQLSLATGPP